MPGSLLVLPLALPLALEVLSIFAFALGLGRSGALFTLRGLPAFLVGHIRHYLRSHLAACVPAQGTAWHLASFRGLRFL